MPLRPRAFVAAGVIAVFASLAFVRLRPPARPGGALTATAVAPIPPPPKTHAPRPHPRDATAVVVPPAPDEAALRELLHAGRFAALLSAASSISDRETRERWLDACAKLAPPPLVADATLHLPDGPLRERLLEQAAERWVLADPVAFGEWAALRLPDATELDRALLRLIERTDTLHRPTSAALEWTGLIREPELRFSALRSVLREWAAADPAAARAYAESSPDLGADQRAALLACLVPPQVET